MGIGDSRWTRPAMHAGWLAGACFAVAVLVLGAAGGGFDAARQPLGDLGALNVSGASLWNVFGFIVPGVLLLIFSLGLETVMRHDEARRGGRLGTGLLMVSALAFAAQGIFPFDMDEPHAMASQWHVSALVFALLALMAGAAFISASLKSRPSWRVLVVLGPAFAALLLLFLVHPPQQLFPMLEGRPGYAHRVIFAAYFCWFALAAAVGLHRGRHGHIARPEV